MTVLVSSAIEQNNPQADGRRKILEVHVDIVGVEYRRRYLAEVGEDINAHLAASAAQLEIQIPEEERGSAFSYYLSGGDPAQFTWNYNPVTEEVHQLCIAFMQADIENAIPLRPTLDAYTNAQIEAFFTIQERTRIRSHSGGLLAIESQIADFNANKEVLE